MLQGLISDIHGNLAALQAVLADMEEAGAHRVICLGDVIGYGPYPGECLDLVRRCGAVLKGNHEEALLDGADAFNPRAKRAIDWTREHINQSDPVLRQQRLDVLANLQLIARSGEWYFVHGSPRYPTREYVMPRDTRSVEKMQDIFSRFPLVCFIGHTHIPGIFLEDLTFTKPEDLWGGTYFVSRGEKALINVGSVGQPRDNDPRACYCLLDDDPAEMRVIFRRVPYDIEATARAIEANTFLDPYLADRLRRGK